MVFKKRMTIAFGRELSHLAICLYCILFLLPAGNSQSKIKTDHHVHIFSPELLTQIKRHKYGAAQFKKADFMYSDIDSILKYNDVQRLWLISTGYAFRQASENIQTDIRLKLKEQNILSNAALKYPNRIIPFYGIDPTKPYALQLLKRSHLYLNFAGIKLHFHASHIDFRKIEHSEALTEILTYTGRHQIPVLIHFPNHKSDFGKIEVDYFFDYILPKGFKQTLIFAHLGSSGWLTEKSLVIIDSIIDHMNKSSIEHNIKFEISGIVSNQYKELEQLSDISKLVLLRKIGFKNLFFGSDYPLTHAQSYFNSMISRLKLTKKEKKQLKSNSWTDN